MFSQPTNLTQSDSLETIGDSFATMDLNGKGVQVTNVSETATNKTLADNSPSDGTFTKDIKKDGTAVYQTFESMNLRHELLRGVFAYGFEKPSVIQQKAIVPFASGRDIIAQAQSGTGKTGTYSVGMLQRIDSSKRTCQALVLVPTRELASQVQHVVSVVGDYMGVKCHACIGGTRLSTDIEILKRGVHVIVGTPGRVMDLIKRRLLDPEALSIVILDEADEMLSKGFLDNMKDIFQLIPKECQAGIFSATMPPEILEICDKILRDPVKVIVKAEELALRGIMQFYVNVEKDQWKLPTLCDLFEEISINQSIIFCNSKNRVDWLAGKMKDNGFPVVATHSQVEDRQSIIRDFKNGTSRVLIATDLYARGIDVQQVSVVINYDMPRDRETYLHRIGRAGRFGRKGITINLVTNDDLGFMRELEKHYDTRLEELPKNVSQLL